MIIPFYAMPWSHQSEVGDPNETSCVGQIVCTNAFSVALVDIRLSVSVTTVRRNIKISALALGRGLSGRGAGFPFFFQFTCYYARQAVIGGALSSSVFYLGTFPGPCEILPLVHGRFVHESG